MTSKLLPAATIAAMLATPAMACTDWKAVAAFDAIGVAQDDAAKERCAKYGDTVLAYHRDRSEMEHKHMEECVAAGSLAERHYLEVQQHRADALDGKCQENVR